METAEAMAMVQREAKVGGELAELPCPMCDRPRSQRSDYIRCTPCATNWLSGENLSKDPRIERFNLVRRSGVQLASVNTATKTATLARERAEGAEG